MVRRPYKHLDMTFSGKQSDCGAGAMLCNPSPRVKTNANLRVKVIVGKEKSILTSVKEYLYYKHVLSFSLVQWILSWHLI